jgi:large subunit ribosomal protein L9
MAQNVILIADVPGLGQLGDNCKVKEGYARNYLIPHRLAMVATPDALKRFEKQKEKLAQERDRRLDRSKSLAEKISKAGLVFERPVGQGGRLFGSVTPMDIAAELSKQGASVEKKSILMNGPIKTVGDHGIRVRIHSQVVVDVPVKVVGKETNQKTSEHPEHPDSLNETPLQPASDDY